MLKAQVALAIADYHTRRSAEFAVGALYGSIDDNEVAIADCAPLLLREGQIDKEFFISMFDLQKRAGPSEDTLIGFFATRTLSKEQMEQFTAMLKPAQEKFSSELRTVALIMDFQDPQVKAYLDGVEFPIEIDSDVLTALLPLPEQKVKQIQEKSVQELKQELQQLVQDMVTLQEIDGDLTEEQKKILKKFKLQEGEFADQLAVSIVDKMSSIQVQLAQRIHQEKAVQL